MHAANKFLLLISLITLSGYSLAKQHNSVSVGVFNEADGSRSGAELIVTAWGDYVGGNLSGVLYANKDKTNPGYDSLESSDIYAGLSAFAFVHTGQSINPYVGLGIFAGKALGCSSAEDDLDQCSEDVELSIYPEIGVSINILEVTVTPYLRRYFDTSTSNKSGNVYGINFGVDF